MSEDDSEFEIEWTNEDNDDLYDDESSGHNALEPSLLRCCGETRPDKPPPPLLVTASTKPYVTIHDYISTVHAWMLQERDHIWRALAVGEVEPLSPTADVFVSHMRPTPLRLIARLKSNDQPGFWERKFKTLAERARIIRDRATRRVVWWDDINNEPGDTH